MGDAQRVVGEDGLLEVEPLLDDPPDDIDSVVRHHPVLSRTLLGKNPNTTAVWVFPTSDATRPPGSVDLVHAVRKVIAEYKGPEEIEAAGPIWGGTGIAEAGVKDIVTMLPLTGVVLTLLMALIYRSFWAAIIPIFVAFVVSIFVISSVTAEGRALSLITTPLPGLFTAIGVAYAMHFLDRYARSSGTGLERATFALRRVALPVAISGITTVVGFAALNVNPLPAIREFALLGTFGVVLALVAVLTVLPSLFAFIGPKLTASDDSLIHRRADSVVAFSSRFTAKHAVLIAILAAFFAVFAAYFGSKVVVDTAYIQWLKPTHPTRAGFLKVRDNLFAPIPMYVTIDTKKDGGALEPDVIARVDALQKELEEIPLVDSSLSIVGFIHDMHNNFHAAGTEIGEDTDTNADANTKNFAVDTDALPTTREQIAQYLFIYENDDAAAQLGRFIDFNRRRLSIWLQADLQHSVASRAAMSEARAAVSRAFPNANVAVTGMMPMFFKSGDRIAIGQLRSLGVALISIFVAIMLTLRSWRLSLIAIPSNVLPILGLFAVMALSGVTLDIGTSVIACVCLGLIVDDTLHIVVGFREAYARLGDANAAIDQALKDSGRAVVFTSVALMASFIVLSFSNYSLVRNMGVLMTITVGFALITDLFLLPVLLRKFGAGLVKDSPADAT
ncbi:MAG: MMPL family transporter [Polyangiales bacterium]